jgi:hypothetical protein
VGHDLGCVSGTNNVISLVSFFTNGDWGQKHMVSNSS